MADMSESAKKAKSALAHVTQADRPATSADFVSTGITPVDLACSDRVLGGLQKGSIYRLIGKSQTGKTFVGGSILCEAAISPHFRDYQLIFNDIEYGRKMNANKFWKPLVSRLKAPAYDEEGVPVYSKTLSDWYAHINKLLDGNKKFIEIVDSLDGLYEPDGETKMTDGKAKVNSQNLRKLIAGVKETGSILILVQHAKVNLGNTWAELITTGGASPEYFSTLDIWLSKCETIKRIYKSINKVQDDDGGCTDEKHEIKLPIGVMFQAHVKKNRVAGVDRVAKFPLYYDYGIDNTGACVLYLLEFGHWTKLKGKIEAPEFGFSGSQADLIKKIEQDSKQQELKMLVGKIWREVEQACSQGRKPRYS